MSQAMRPHGVIGRLFAALMERMNEGAYQWTVDRLHVRQPKSFYEIGFGTGRLLELAAGKLLVQRLRGVDPSDLMVDMASKRLRKFAPRCEIDVRAGDNRSAFWRDEKFDAIAALHSFQFWSNPAETLTNLRGQLAPNGSLILILRSHGRNPPSWLPNPISRSRDEVSSVRAALSNARFAIAFEESIDRASHGLFAVPN